MGQAKLRGSRELRVLQAKRALLVQMAEVEDRIKALHPKNKYRSGALEAEWRRLYERYSNVW